MPDRYPMMNLLETVAKDPKFKFKIDSGPVHFILPLMPDDLFQAQVAAAESDGRNSPFQRIDNLGQKVLEAVTRFPVPSTEPPPEGLPAYEGTQAFNALVCASGEIAGEEGSTYARVVAHREHLKHVSDKLRPAETNNQPEPPSLVQHADRMLPVIEILIEMDVEFRDLFADVRDATARNVLLDVLPQTVTRTRSMQTLRPWLELLDICARDTEAGLEMIAKEVQECETYLNNVESATSEYEPYLASFIGLDLYANLTSVGGEGRDHKAPVSLHNLQGLSDRDAPDLASTLAQIESSRGIVAIPGFMDPDGACRRELDKWLNDTSHSHFAVIDTVQPPDWAEDDPGAWFDQVAAADSPQGNQRAHARTLTFMPPLQRQIKGKTHMVSPVYAGTALLSRAQLGSNPAFPQIPYEMGIVDCITGTLGQSKTRNDLTVDRQEGLMEKGYNAIAQNYNSHEGKTYYVMSPAATLSLQASRNRFVTEAIAALLEDMTQEYLRWNVQGGLSTATQVQAGINTLFSELQRQGKINGLVINVTPQPNGQFLVNVGFAMTDVVESIAITVQKIDATRLLN